MLKIEVINLPEIRELIGAMRDKIDAFAPIGGNSEMSQELLRWQVEDMRRRYPEVEEPDPWTAVTRVYPRSRKVRPSREKARALRPRRPKLRLRRRPAGQRPILRPALFEKLSDRMQRLMEEKLTWR